MVADGISSSAFFWTFIDVPVFCGAPVLGHPVYLIVLKNTEKHPVAFLVWCFGLGQPAYPYLICT